MDGPFQVCLPALAAVQALMFYMGRFPRDNKIVRIFFYRNTREHKTAHA
jgi:hypothetical protein